MKKWKKTAERTRRRTMRNRKKVRGTADRPRLSVFRSSRYIYVQLIDDVSGETLASSSSLTLERVKGLTSKYGGNCDAAKEVGLDIAAKAKDKGLTEVRLDRGPYKYHGRIKALSDGAREGGLVF
jgi:large subunit ribosomal protein L18